MSAGDIELNPGPSVIYPCTLCNKAVRDADQAILCDRCDNWTHASCCGLSIHEYQHLEDQGVSCTWFCPTCQQQDLPFANSSPLSLNSSFNSSQSSQTPSKNTSKSNNISCYLYNARSIMNKRDDLSALLTAHCPDVVAITETFLEDEIGDVEIIENSPYTAFRHDRNRHGGGVMILVRNTICATRRADLENDTELLWIEISHTTGQLVLGVFYRPPNSDREYLTSLQNSLALIPDAQNIILCGDFNLPNINWEVNSPTSPSPLASLLCDISSNSSLQQLVVDPTRGNNTLDLVFTNTQNRINNVQVIDGIAGSDHDGVSFDVSLKLQSAAVLSRYLFNFKRADFNQFRETLSTVPWDCCFLECSIERAWTNFKDLLFAAADQCIPKFRLKQKKSKSWLSDETLSLIKKKRRSYRMAKRSRNPKYLSNYKSLCNTVRNLTRRDRNIHLEQMTKDLHRDQKPFWRWLKNIRSSHCTTTPDLHYFNKTLKSAVDKAKALNNYFTSVFTKETTSSVEHALPLRSTVETNNMQFDEVHVYNLLCKIDPSKSTGPDNIPGRLLKEGAPWLAKPLTKLFNMSMAMGQLPKDWIRANITPIHKKGSKHRPENYRPISLTSIVVKIMERLVHQELSQFLSDNNKLNSSQHGFRNKHSCQTQLLECVHQWAKALDHRSSIHTIFLDFSKAFDTVPHMKLCAKLDNIGIRGNILNWVKAFLTNRQQRVCLDGSHSDWAQVSSGVPQGSILGPLLFIIYVNDISTNLDSETKLFADDCTLYRTISCMKDCISLQNDLSKIYRWSQTWQLSLNITKCKVLCISNKRSPPTYNYVINNTSLELVNKIKYLGVFINNHLTWNDNVSYASHKATRILNILRRSMYRCQRSAKRMAFTALVRPHLEYAAPVWSPHTTSGKLALEKVQKRAAHWICSKWDKQEHRWTKTYDEALSQLQWPTVSQRHTFLACCQTYKIVHSLDCIDFNKYFSFNTNNTRHHQLALRCCQSRVNSFRFSFFINAPYVWNNLPSSTVSASSLASFKTSLSLHLARP